MRRFVNQEKLEEVMIDLGKYAKTPGTIYITGGSTALLLGIRNQTIDIDIKMDPEPGGIFEAIADVKVRLAVNIELASPDQFIPALPGWQDRSRYIATHGSVVFRHYDFYAQALSKIERGYSQDVTDAHALVGLGLIDVAELERLSAVIRKDLVRYPAIDPIAYDRKVQAFLDSVSNDPTA